MIVNNIALVTGATGFIGGRIAQRLLDDGYAVRVLVRDPNKLPPRLRTQCEVVVGDMLDTASVAEAIQQAALIFHCAANVKTWDTYESYYATNVQGVKNLMQAIAQVNPHLSRLVHVSTVDVYGFPDLPCDEARVATGGEFSYGKTKLIGENWVRSKGDELGISYTIIRPCNVIGPGSQFIARIGAELKSGLMVTIAGGHTHAGLVDIDHLVDDVVWAAKAPCAHRECYNVRDDIEVDWAEFLRVFRQGTAGKGLVLNLPFVLADKLAWGFETMHHALLPRHEPLLHRLLVRFFGKTCGHSIAKIRAHRGDAFYANRDGFDETMRRSCLWFNDRAGNHK
jgi:nucleoside-diphosphate-sugar epimerase